MHFSEEIRELLLNLLNPYLNEFEKEVLRKGWKHQTVATTTYVLKAPLKVVAKKNVEVPAPSGSTYTYVEKTQGIEWKCPCGVITKITRANIIFGPCLVYHKGEDGTYHVLCSKCRELEDKSTLLVDDLTYYFLCVFFNSGEGLLCEHIASSELH